MRTLIALALLTVVAAADAQAPGYVPGHTPTHAPTYTPLTPPALFQFVQPPTTPPPVVLTPGLLPAAQPAAQPLTAEDIRRIIREEIAAQRTPAKVRAQKAAPPATQALPSTAAPKVPATASIPPADPAAIAALITRAAQIATTHCADCHTSPGRGKLDLFDAAGTFAPQTSWRSMHASVAPNPQTGEGPTMPRVPEKLTAEEVAVFAALAEAEKAGAVPRPSVAGQVK